MWGRGKQVSTHADVQKLKTEELHAGARALVADDREAVVALLFFLMELDARHEYGNERSLWDYCRNALRLTERQSFLRMTAARLIKEYPQAVPRLKDGRLSLSSLVALKDVLTPGEATRLLTEAEGKTKEEVEQIAAMRKSRVVAKSSVVPLAPNVVPMSSAIADLRQDELLAAATAPSEGGGAATPQSLREQTYLVTGVSDVRELKVVSATQCKLTLTAPIALRNDLAELTTLLSHVFPSGDLAEVVQYAVTKLLTQLRKKKGLDGPEASPPATGDSPAAAAESPPPAPAPPLQPDVTYAKDVASRGEFARPHIPAELLRRVWKRDKGRCQFRLENGKICGSRWRCETDHVEPIARGGATAEGNLRVVCRAHNLEAERLVFGDEFVERKIRERSKSSPRTRLRCGGRRIVGRFRPRRTAGRGRRGNDDRYLPWGKQKEAARQKKELNS